MSSPSAPTPVPTQRDGATPGRSGRLRGQPTAVWAVLFACIVAFMGIGLVDPILPVIAKGVHASASQVELLFTSYFLIIGVSNLLAGYASTRLGAKNTLLCGLALVVVFSALAGSSDTVAQIVGFRAGWGLGIALFVSTSMSVIVATAAGGVSAAVVLFESALGVGIASGPLVGGLLGGVSWRAPFFGVAILLAIGFVAFLRGLAPTPRPPARERIGALEPLKALRHRSLLAASVIALLYNFGFFTLLAYTPLPLGLGVPQRGIVFFAWGALLALGAVFGAPLLTRRFSLVPLLATLFVMIAVDLLVVGFGIHSQQVMIPAIIVSGAFLGVANASLSTLLMRVSVAGPSISASATNFVRFVGGAIAPYLAGKLSTSLSVGAPLFVAAVAVGAAIALLALARSALEIDVHAPAQLDGELAVEYERELAAT
ncbi:MAG: transporter, family, multidrug resistance protein [Solirubrobacteraceae bacterium]|nr:transporter, family, multidrug resistance protein [Solirubrobacteraceae bacterium]